jgi:hypothetical protein
MTLKGHYFEKIEREIIYRPETNNFQILFFINPLNQKIFSAYMENTLNVLKFYISRLIIEEPEKNFRSSLSVLDRFDSAKKLSHATVPLISTGEWGKGLTRWRVERGYQLIGPGVR